MAASDGSGSSRYWGCIALVVRTTCCTKACWGGRPRDCRQLASASPDVASVGSRLEAAAIYGLVVIFLVRLATAFLPMVPQRARTDMGWTAMRHPRRTGVVLFARATGQKVSEQNVGARQEKTGLRPCMTSGARLSIASNQLLRLIGGICG